MPSSRVSGSAYSDADNFDAIQDYRAEREPYLHHSLSYQEADKALFPDAVSCPVRRDDSEASTPLPERLRVTDAPPSQLGAVPVSYEPCFTVAVHHHPRGFFASCDPTDGEELLSHTHPMPGGALHEMGDVLDRYLDGLAVNP